MATNSLGFPPDSARYPANSPGNPQNGGAFDACLRRLGSDRGLLKEARAGNQVGFYRLQKEIGKGNFSRVRCGVHVLLKRRVAVKVIDCSNLNSKGENLIIREVGCMLRLNHPNIIRLYQVIQSSTKIYMVLELASGGDLELKILDEGKFSEAAAKQLFQQIILALEYIHSKNVVHRDLKAENIFFCGPHTVKIGDFGFGRFRPSGGTNADPVVPVDLSRLNTYCGSPPYAAPELFQDNIYNGVCVDVWAAGVILYFIVVGHLPFEGDSVCKLKKHITEVNYKIPAFISKSCSRLIGNLLLFEASDRLTAAEILQSDWLEHNQDAQETLRLAEPINEEEIDQETWQRLSQYDITKQHLASPQHDSASSSPHHHHHHHQQLHPQDLNMNFFLDKCRWLEATPRGQDGSRTMLLSDAGGVYRMLRHEVEMERLRPKRLPMPQRQGSKRETDSAKQKSALCRIL